MHAAHRPRAAHPHRSLCAAPAAAPAAPAAGNVLLCCTPSQPLAQCALALKESRLAANVALMESWHRVYQVLPRRTHPDMTTSAGSGFFLHAVKLADAIPPRVDNPHKRRRRGRDDDDGNSGEEDAGSADDAEGGSSDHQADGSGSEGVREGGRRGRGRQGGRGRGRGRGRGGKRARGRA